MPRKTLFAPRAQEGGGRFNEAAARCRGKPDERRSTRGTVRRFNEAAARCRGKRRAAPPRDFPD